MTKPNAHLTNKRRREAAYAQGFEAGRTATAAATLLNWGNPEDPVVKLFVDFDVAGYLDEYEYAPDEVGYSPNEKERAILTDAILGVIGNLHEELRKLIPSSSAALAKDAPRGIQFSFKLIGSDGCDIRLEHWPEGYALERHGEYVWREELRPTEAL